MSDINKELLTYNKCKIYADSIKRQLKESNYIPDVIVAPLRGGLFLSQEILYFDEELGKNIKFFAIDIKTYKGKEVSEPEFRNKSVYKFFLSELDPDKGLKFLFVDDIIDTSTTLDFFKKDFESIKREGDELKTASLVANKESKNNVDYFCRVKLDEWFEFPWDN